MKFGEFWKSQTVLLPLSLQASCINYKKYKKLTKNISGLGLSTNDIIGRLHTDSLNVDGVLHKVYSVRSHQLREVNKVNICLCPSDKPCKDDDIDYSTLEKYIKINIQCLYKICKRLDKRLNSKDYMQWYETIRAQRVFAFANRLNSICIELRGVNSNVNECPICMERPSDFILGCGHLFCKTCVLSMLNVVNKKGTLNNLIAYGCYSNPHLGKCPICRDKRAFVNYIDQSKH